MRLRDRSPFERTRSLPTVASSAKTTTAEILVPKAAEGPAEEPPEQEQARVLAKLKGMSAKDDEDQQ